MSEIADRLRELRTTAGWKQDELAERVDVSTNYISMIERGRRRPSPDLLKRLAAVFHVPVTKLLRAAGYADDIPDSLEAEIAELIRAYPDWEGIFEFARDYPDKLPEVLRFARYLLSGEEREAEGVAPAPRSRVAAADTT